MSPSHPRPRDLGDSPSLLYKYPVIVAIKSDPLHSSPEADSSDSSVHVSATHWLGLVLLTLSCWKNPQQHTTTTRRGSRIQKGGFIQEFRLENRSYPDVHDFNFHCACK